MHRVLSVLAWTVLAFPVAACDKGIISPPLPTSAVEFAPLPVYAQWWATTEACSGRTGSLGAVRWYQVPGDLAEMDGKRVDAYWSAADNRIVLTAGVVKNGPVVRHEMLHALLREKGHSRSAFLGKCAGRVSCASQCVEDAGNAPPAPVGVVLRPPSALEVSMVITPTQPNRNLNGGYFSITVSVKNPLTVPVIADLPSVANTGAVAFSCHLAGPLPVSRTVYPLDSSTSTFAPGEVKLHIFDFFVGDTGQPGELFAGNYKATCGYGFHFAPEWVFTAF